MHEMSIMASVVDAATDIVKENKAQNVTSITLQIGEMTEVVPDALEFAFEALSPGTVLAGAEMHIEMLEPESRCLECGAVYTHDRFQMVCPQCDSFVTELLHGRELDIKSIELHIEDEN